MKQQPDGQDAQDMRLLAIWLRHPLLVRRLEALTDRSPMHQLLLNLARSLPPLPRQGELTGALARPEASLTDLGVSKDHSSTVRD